MGPCVTPYLVSLPLPRDQAGDNRLFGTVRLMGFLRKGPGRRVPRSGEEGSQATRRVQRRKGPRQQTVLEKPRKGPRRLRTPALGPGPPDARPWAESRGDRLGAGALCRRPQAEGLRALVRKLRKVRKLRPERMHWNPWLSDFAAWPADNQRESGSRWQGPIIKALGRWPVGYYRRFQVRLNLKDCLLFQVRLNLEDCLLFQVRLRL